MTFENKYWPRNIDSFNLLESFLVSAVSSLLIIRFYLEFSGFPQIGGSRFHIAHMLWGGLLMLIAIGILLTFLGRHTKYSAAILGGIGFGAFIDELGKFITHDNNYFFQPTIALIYVIFVLLYLLIHSLSKNARYTKSEYLINALEIVKEVVIGDFDSEEKKQTAKLLKKSDPQNSIVKVLGGIFEKVEIAPSSEENLFIKARRELRNFYLKLSERKFFTNVLIAFFIFKALAAIFQAAFFVGDLTGLQEVKLTFIQLGLLISSILSGILVIFGVYKIRHSKLVSYQMFKYSVLVSIFLTQVFAFYQEQLSAIIGLAFNLLVLIVLDYMITREQRLFKQE